MPQIVEYVNREGLTPTDRGTEARVQEGRRIGAAFNQTAESLRDFGNRAAQQIGGAIRDAGDAAVAWQDQRQIHQGATMGAGIFNQLTQKQNDIVNAIDSNDPAYSSKVDMAMQQFRENEVEPTLEKFYQGFTTEKSKAWAEQHIDQMRQHFYIESAARTASAASLGVKTGTQNTLTTLSNTVVQDPSSATLKTALSLWESTVGGIVGTARGINPSDAAAAQSTLLEAGRRKLVNDSAASGIQRAPDPEAEAAQRIKDWPQYITGDEALRLGKAAKVQNKANDLTDRQAAAFQRQQQNDLAKAAAADNIAKNVTVDPATGKVSASPKFTQTALSIPKRFPDAPDAAELAKTYMNWAAEVSRERRENPATWPDVMTDLYSRMSSPDNPTKDVEIYQAETEHKLSRQDSQSLLNLHKALESEPLNTPAFKTTMKAVEEELGVGLLGDGHIRYSGFMQAFVPQYQKMVRTGTLPPDALNLGDPNSLISKSLAQFRPDSNQLMMGKMLKQIGLGSVNFENLPPNIKEAITKSQGVNATSVRKGGETYGVNPPSDRKAGQVYPTPRGPMKWTGTGWVQP